jgi:hypothetical protein
VRGLPELVRDDPALRQLHVDQVRGWPRLLGLRSPPVGLLGAIPEDPTAVELVDLAIAGQEEVDGVQGLKPSRHRE